MAQNYTLTNGLELRFKQVKQNITELQNVINAHVLSLNSVQAFCIVDRVEGRIIQKRFRTLLVFYIGADEYKADNLIIGEKLEELYKGKSETLDLISLDANRDFTLAIVETLTERGFKIFEKE
ncbi:MAG: hypothetical protein WCK02_15910 [Bacteroidota bacterium]